MRAGVQSLWSIDFRFPRFPSSQAHAFTISNTTSKDLNLIPCNFQHFVTMAPTYTLYSPAGSFRAFAPLIAAEYNGVNVNVDTEGVEAAVAAKSPTGKAPILETPNGVIFSSAAMARYVAGLRRDTGLLGNSLQEQAAVDSWMDWCAQDIELPACVWWYPVAGYMPSNEDA
jgi:elongation factor 1-gamma